VASILEKVAARQECVSYGKSFPDVSYFAQTAPDSRP
jgi:Domain of unknown function (DUF6894)